MLDRWKSVCQKRIIESKLLLLLLFFKLDPLPSKLTWTHICICIAFMMLLWLSEIWWVDHNDMLIATETIRKQFFNGSNITIVCKQSLVIFSIHARLLFDWIIFQISTSKITALQPHPVRMYALHNVLGMCSRSECQNANLCTILYD